MIIPLSTKTMSSAIASTKGHHHAYHACLRSLSVIEKGIRVKSKSLPQDHHNRKLFISAHTGTLAIDP